MKVNMKKIESLMILRGVNVTELMQAAGLERATYYYIKKKGGTSPRTLKAIADTLNVYPRELLSSVLARRPPDERAEQILAGSPLGQEPACTAGTHQRKEVEKA